MIENYRFRKIDIKFCADPVEDADLIREYTEYEQRVEKWNYEKKRIVPVIKDRDRVCQICGSDENLVIDHIIPMRQGGSNKPENLRVLCWECNSRKAAEDRVYSSVRKQPKWRQRQGY